MKKSRKMPNEWYINLRCRGKAVRMCIVNENVRKILHFRTINDFPYTAGTDQKFPHSVNSLEKQSQLVVSFGMQLIPFRSVRKFSVFGALYAFACLVHRGCFSRQITKNKSCPLSPSKRVITTGIIVYVAVV